MRFTKMHGCGNDYVYIDAWRERVPSNLPKLARAISDRHTGVGADGLIIIGPSRRADARMVMFNADGSRSEMCGNGIRCAAKLAHDHGHLTAARMRIETSAGILDVELQKRGRAVVGASVLMGRPRLSPAAVPVRLDASGPLLPLTLSIAGSRLRLLAVGMGNPHAVCFVDDPDDFPVATVGPLIERHARFPKRTNVEFVARLRDERGIPVLRQRTWERGSGETQACGTGACATLVAAILDQRIDGRAAIIRLDGGDLHVAWPTEDAPVRLTGPAVTVFDGTYPA
ncbi:MAG: diaminopimelate epimerase [Planctomycetes bacterium]|nr:diaminopimelate epimerase [Planctomycetota bacterium]